MIEQPDKYHKYGIPASYGYLFKMTVTVFFVCCRHDSPYLSSDNEANLLWNALHHYVRYDKTEQILLIDIQHNERYLVLAEVYQFYWIAKDAFL